MQKYILLDIDGVMISAASWKPLDVHPDGFYRFSDQAGKYLDWLMMKTAASIILTSTHRTLYDRHEWKNIFGGRFHHVQEVQTLDDFHLPFNITNRLDEVLQWAATYGKNQPYVIIDDDSSLQNLPHPVKENWVKTQPLIGLNKETADMAFRILSKNRQP